MNEFISGSLGGLVGTILSHPIDTIKTRIQSGSAKNIFDAIHMKKFYSGIRALLLGIPLEKKYCIWFL